MKHLWQQLGRLLSPQTVTTHLDLEFDDLIVSQPPKIERLMKDLAQDPRAVDAYSTNGIFIGKAKLRWTQQHGLAFQWIQPSRSLPAPEIPCVNVRGLTSRGAVLFTLRLMERAASICQIVSLPREMIWVQSREHYRLSGFHGPRHHAALHLKPEYPAIPLHDLSEQGLGLRLGQPSVITDTRIEGSCELEIDGLRLPLPHLEVMHCNPVSNQLWRVGVRFSGLSATESRKLRHWIDTVETGKISLMKLAT